MYQIIPTSEAHKISEKDSPTVSNRLEEVTSCAVFRLKNGEAILIPFDSTTSALFDSMEECMKFVEMDRIDEVRTGNRFEYIKNNIFNIKESWVYFVSMLSSRLKREILITNEKVYLIKLNKDILKYGKRNAEQDLYVEIGVFLCAVLKEIVDGEWHIREHNKTTKYNYFIPIIKDKQEIEYSCWKQMAESFYENRKFDIVDFISRASIYGNIDISGDRIVKK
jgi:hypothetical protein